MPEMGIAKRHIDDFAIFGGEAMFEQPRHVGQPNIGDRSAFYARLDQALDSGRLSNGGPLVKEFEDRIAVEAGVEHAVAMTNGTVAIALTARALELTGEVIVPSFTFVGTVNALEWAGLTPVFADIGAHRPVLDPASVERLIGPRTSAILNVHLWGHVGAVEALDAISERHGLPIFHDAAHALRNSHRGVPVGSFGQAEIFSFHATKFVNAFEGGAVTTADRDLSRRLRRLRNFGFMGHDRTVLVGINAKMHEASAAMGLTSLDAADEFIATNRANAARYAAALDGIDGIASMSPEPKTGNAQYVVYRLDSERARIERDVLLAVLSAENVRARRYFYPGCHRLEPYRHRAELVREPLTHTERLAEEVLVLPTGSAVSGADVDAIAGLIRFALAHADEIVARMPAIIPSPVR
jgi:dTDP-4-amino-4,6-dideoxyglucose